MNPNKLFFYQDNKKWNNFVIEINLLLLQLPIHLPMKKNVLLFTFVLLSAFTVILSCSKTTTSTPCDGKGVLNIENKLDSAMTVNIVEAKLTVTLAKDYTRPFTLTGNNPYTVKIIGSNYQKDTTFMILPCDNKLYIVSKY